ncbi:MAG: hypothetical protein WC635_01310 [Bacteriovorax sp.]|jgi:alpha-glucosidase
MTWHIVSIFIFSSFSLPAADFPCHYSSPQSQLGPSTEKLALDIQTATNKIIKGTQPEFYKKFLNSNGLLIKGSQKVSDTSLARASETLNKMLGKRADIRNNLIDKKADIVIIAPSENYCSFPETEELKGTKTFDGRDFCEICGAGGNEGRPITAICEDNLLKTKKDPYFGSEDILTHELAHTIHILGMNESTKKRLNELYNIAKRNNLFAKNKNGEATYVMANDEEFFACLSAVWFGAHNPKSTAFPPELRDRDSIRQISPLIYEFLKEIYPE